MAKYTGYVVIPHSTYDEWKNAVNGNGYDADSSYGCQCWDLAAEFWWNVGFPQGYPHLAGTHAAYGAWDDRVANATYNGTTYFDLITSVSDIQKGDIIVFDQYQGNPYGHIGFADQNFTGFNYINILSENNGGTPDPAGGAYANVASYSLTHFRGAFRYKAWHTTPPTPTPTTNKSKFPFVLYAKKFREQRSML